MSTCGNPRYGEEEGGGEATSTPACVCVKRVSSPPPPREAACKPSRCGLINCLLNNECLNTTNDLPEAGGGFHLRCWYSGRSSANVIIIANTGFLPCLKWPPAVGRCLLCCPAPRFSGGGAGQQARVLEIELGFPSRLAGKRWDGEVLAPRFFARRDTPPPRAHHGSSFHAGGGVSELKLRV